MANPTKHIKRRALKIEQDPKHPLIVFSLTGDDLSRIAEISRISRDDAGKLIGYQRPEVKKHIQDIVDYLDSGDVLFPNAIILALSSRAKFTSSRGPEVDDGCAVAGTIEIPIPQGDEAKPAWIVDGQQRTLALCKSKKSKLGVPVCAFIADDVPIQKDQFFRINTTRPLPRGLISELLPEVSTNLPSRLASKQIPAAVVEWLATDATSPFCRIVRRSSMKTEDVVKTVIADSSLIKMVEESIGSPTGCLYPFRNVTTNQTDFDGIFQVLVTYWTAVRNVFPNAWGKTPEKSRLMHGAGIRSMGRLMDKIMPNIKNRGKKGIQDVEKELSLIAPSCHWTSGNWEAMNGMAWNEIQNVPKHIQLLSWVVINLYLQAKK
jgi:DGQHR domain-containing protein